MPTEVYLVKVGMNMTEGIVEEWCVADGGHVELGELLYRLETEKVNLDVDAEATGTVKHIVAEGVAMKPGDIVGYIFADGETIPADVAAHTRPPPSASPQAAAQPTATSVAPASGDGQRIPSSPAARKMAGELGIDMTTLLGSGPGGRIIETDVAAAAAAAAPATPSSPSRAASPAAKKLARESGIDLAGVQGTGPGGRITLDDVKEHARAPASPAAPVTSPDPPREDTIVPIKGMRRTIAARMHDSLMTMAQLTMDMDVNMDDAVKLRGQLVAKWADIGVRPTYTDLVIHAAAKALAQHPAMNAVFGESEIIRLGEINVGMAVALPEGLIVPVIRNADQMGLRELATESSRLATAVRDNSLSPDELMDATFTVTALGMFGVDSFTPIINPPQAGILGVNRIRDDLRWASDTPVKTQVMRLSLTWDHRVLDGAPAAEFLGAVRDLLEAPFRLLV
ncbi:MAG: 2-oxo acid dehydrogenase subunit E2 [Pseudomonadales bacterium]|jgi:pyruvate dehydrogenase E2 component (dihydrolipoamide acetyltransferase)|nr:2-oxo acid dehydrogenase subunit E2 [Pseudomonadales bacterium]MDP6472257.1 2-oxo acid dehydrogenase subunit E2 [Pseudomonadales bacterium]MDP6826491.1 2-oxo acid dehydrogenase subunit E2 [Pseudomonadales bacterium]MDP6970676.1 2-oxo acid dehydrogenase subunit E2 [Pseudomonadales bacterium]